MPNSFLPDTATANVELAAGWVHAKNFRLVFVEKSLPSLLRNWHPICKNWTVPANVFWVCFWQGPFRDFWRPYIAPRCAKHAAFIGLHAWPLACFLLPPVLCSCGKFCCSHGCRLSCLISCGGTANAVAPNKEAVIVRPCLGIVCRALLKGEHPAFVDATLSLWAVARFGK
jgi:hypothetical protein